VKEVSKLKEETGRLSSPAASSLVHPDAPMDAAGTSPTKVHRSIGEPGEAARP